MNIEGTIRINAHNESRNPGDVFAARIDDDLQGQGICGGLDPFVYENK